MNEEKKNLNQSLNNTKISYLNWSDFVKNFLQKSSITMIWGNVGIGKTTLALQLSREILKKNLKVFYLYTKFGPLDQLIKRILSVKKDLSDSGFILWHSQSFYRQKDIILNWLLQIQQLSTYFKEKKVGLLIIDEIVSLYLLELGKEAKNEKLNQDLVLLLATLKKIQVEYQIPILILNTFSIKQNEKKESEVVPHGGKIIDYWTSFEIKIDRTAQVSRMKFSIIKNKDFFEIPQKWSWNLSENGFK